MSVDNIFTRELHFIPHPNDIMRNYLLHMYLNTYNTLYFISNGLMTIEFNPITGGLYFRDCLDRELFRGFELTENQKKLIIETEINLKFNLNIKIDHIGGFHADS